MASPMEVLVAVFNDQTPADAMVGTLKKLNKDGTVKMVDVAIVSHGADGKAKIKEIDELTTVKGGERGAIVGGVIGLIFPPSFLASAAVGAIAGGLWGKIRDTGIKSGDLKTIANELKPGEVAVIAVVEDTWVDKYIAAATGYERLFRQTLDAKAAAVLVADPVPGEAVAAGTAKADPPAPAPATDAASGEAGSSSS